MGERVSGHVLTACEDAAAAANTAMERWISISQEAIARRGRFVVVLAGGSTPKSLYQLLAALPAGQLDWSRTVVLFGDERCVGPDHLDSNYRMAKESLLGRVPIPAGNVHRILGEDGPRKAAARYDGVLRQLFSSVAAADAPIDLALLGMGADGHTASLFPGRDFSADANLLAAAAVAPPESPVRDRVTMTLPAFAASARIVMLTVGAGKRQMVGRILAAAKTRPDPILPSSLLTCRGEVEWIVDRAAAPQ